MASRHAGGSRGRRLPSLTAAPSVFFSLLREHSIDGTGWAPTRTLKVECSALDRRPGGLSLREPVSWLSCPHGWPGIAHTLPAPCPPARRGCSAKHLPPPVPLPPVLSGAVGGPCYLHSPLPFTVCASGHLPFFSFSVPTLEEGGEQPGLVEGKEGKGGCDLCLFRVPGS